MTQEQMDYRKLEAKMKLRKLELEAYSSLINAFRAQGYFSLEKKRILLELRSYLGISIERHQAEVRRAINDDKLSKISSNINGEDKLDAWIIEGRRIVPLLKRMAPQTAVSEIADKVAKYQVRQNQIEQEQFVKQMKEQHSSTLNSIEVNNNVDDIVNKQSTRKRQNSSESTNSKRKITTSDKCKTNQNKPSNKPTITIPSSNFIQNDNLNQQQKIRNESNSSSTHNNVILNDKHPKLLIMSSTNSATSVNKPILNTINQNLLHQHPLNQQLLNQHSIISTCALSPLTTDSQLIKVDNRIDLEEINNATGNTSTINKQTKNSLNCNQPVSQKTIKQLIPTSSTNPTSVTIPKIYNQQQKVQTASSSSPKLMILNSNLPNSSGQQTKTLTISHSPIHNVKTLQLPSQNSTILYSTQQPIIGNATLNCTPNTIKTIPGIAIQTIKAQSGNKSNNFIIMPNKAANNSGSTQAKGLLRQMNAKEFPLKIYQQQNDKIELNELGMNQQQTIILTTNVNKDTGQPNIIKYINLPINRIASPNSPNDASKATISITQTPNSTAKSTNLTSNSLQGTIQKTNFIKIPANATTETITKLIYNNVISNNSIGSSIANIGPSVTPITAQLKSSEVSSTTSLSSVVEGKKITVIKKTSSPMTDTQKYTIEKLSSTLNRDKIKEIKIKSLPVNHKELSQSSLNKETIQDISNKDTLSKDTLIEDNISKVNLVEDKSIKNESIKDDSCEQNIKKNEINKDLLIQDNLIKDDVNKDESNSNDPSNEENSSKQSCDKDILNKIELAVNDKPIAKEELIVENQESSLY